MDRKTIENAALKARAGFTLIELLVVVGILGILGAIAIQNMTGHTEKAKLTATQTAIHTIADTLSAYANNHKLPTSQQGFIDALTSETDTEVALLVGGEAALNDAWGNQIQYSKYKNSFDLRSAGPDEQMNTEDDITFQNHKGK